MAEKPKPCPICGRQPTVTSCSDPRDPVTVSCNHGGEGCALYLSAWPRYAGPREGLAMADRHRMAAAVLAAEDKAVETWNRRYDDGD